MIAAAQYTLIFIVRPLLAVAYGPSRRTQPEQGDFTLQTPVSPGIEDKARAPLQ